MFNEDPRFGEATLIDEQGNTLKKVRTFSFNRNPGERVTLLDPVLVPIPNSVNVKVDDDAMVATFKVNVLRHEGMVFTRTFEVAPSVTCERQSRPHALNSHGPGYPCATVIPGVPLARAADDARRAGGGALQGEVAGGQGYLPLGCQSPSAR